MTLMFSINFFGLELDCPTCISATDFKSSMVSHTPLMSFVGMACKTAMMLTERGGWSL